MAELNISVEHTGITGSVVRVVANINVTVWVGLTVLGREQLHEYYTPFFEFGAEAVQRRLDLADKHEGWFSFQLWELMEIFGPKTASTKHTSLPSFVGNNIYFTKPQGA